VTDSAGQKPLPRSRASQIVIPMSLPRPGFIARMVGMRETDIKILLKTKST